MQAGVDVSKHGGHAYPGMEDLYGIVDRNDLEANAVAIQTAGGTDDGFDAKMNGIDMRDGLHGRVSLKTPSVPVDFCDVCSWPQISASWCREASATRPAMAARVACSCCAESRRSGEGERQGRPTPSNVGNH